MNKIEINGNAWVFKSARVQLGLAKFAQASGLDNEGGERLVKAVAGFVRRDIRENGCTSFETETKAGKPKTIEAKTFEPKQKVSGKGEATRITWRTGEQILIGQCSLFTRRFVRQDDVFAQLEEEGAGVEYVPVAGSVEERKLAELVTAIRAQLAAERNETAKRTAEDAATRASREAAELAQLG